MQRDVMCATVLSLLDVLLERLMSLTRNVRFPSANVFKRRKITGREV